MKNKLIDIISKENKHRKAVDKKRWKYTDESTMLRSYLDDALEILKWMLYILIFIAVLFTGAFIRLLVL